MLGRHPAALRVRHGAPVGDAEQGVVRLVHRRGGEEALVGGHQRQPGGVRERDQPGLDGALQRQAVPVQLHDGAVVERLGEGAQQRRRLGLARLGQQPGQRAAGAAGQQEQALCVVQHGTQRKLRVRRIGGGEAERGQALQVGQPGGVLRQQHDRVRGHARLVGADQADLAADDRLHALARAGLAELQRAEQVGRVGDGDGGHPGIPRQGGDLVSLDRALAQRIGGVDSEVDEVGVRHGE